MKHWRPSFNINLAAVALLLLAGCDLGGMGGGLSSKKDYSTLRIYLESEPGDGTLVRVGKDKIPVYVQSEPILTEDDVSGARLVDNADGTYGIDVKLSDHGSIVLDMDSTANRGRRLVFFCQYRPKRSSGDELPVEMGSGLPWISMTVIRKGLTGGVVEFTPAVSREAAGQIVKGINNMVSDMNKFDQ